MVRINWTIRAETDLKNIHDYIAVDSKRFAKRQVNRIVEHAKNLDKHLYLGRVVPEINDTDIRELLLDRYRIVYRIISKEQLDILTVHHTSRDFDKRESEIKKNK